MKSRMEPYEATSEVIRLVEEALSGDLTDANQQKMAQQLDDAVGALHSLWTLALEDQLVSGNRQDFPGEEYFREKLLGLMSFARMAVGIEDRMGYRDEKIMENVRHFAYQVDRIVGRPPLA